MLGLSAKRSRPLIGWETQYERRFRAPLEGPAIPFGSMIKYHPISAKDQPRRHQFSEKVLPRIFQGYALYAGGIWKGDNLVADIVELENVDASDIHARRLSAKEVITPNSGENFIFPCADGTVKLSGGDQVFPKIRLNAGSTPERRRAQW